MEREKVLKGDKDKKIKKEEWRIDAEKNIRDRV